MDRVRGVYESGKVLLQQSVDWPDGLQVDVLRETGRGTDVCIDGSQWADRTEDRQKWIEWFDSLQPVFTGDELAQFEASIRALHDEQKGLLAGWQARIANLLK